VSTRKTSVSRDPLLAAARIGFQASFSVRRVRSCTAAARAAAALRPGAGSAAAAARSAPRSSTRAAPRCDMRHAMKKGVAWGVWEKRKSGIMRRSQRVKWGLWRNEKGR
jgi:hypothetical protein